MKYILLIFNVLLTTSMMGQASMNMTLLGTWDNDNLPTNSSGNSFNECWGYAADGREYAFIGSTIMVHCFDVTDASNPQLIDEFEGGQSTTWRDMKTWGHYLYSVSDVTSEGLMIFDLSDLPNSITKVNQIDAVFEKAHNIFVDESNNRLHVVGSTVDLWTFDLAANPENPVLLAGSSLPGGEVHDIYIRDHIAYASHLSAGLYIYDFTDLNNILTLGVLESYPGQIFNHSSWLSEDGQTLIFCDEKHGEAVKALDVSDFTDLFVEESNLFRSTLLAPEHTNSIAHNPLIKDDLVFISYNHDGVQVFDISDINNVQRVAYYDGHENTDYNGFKGVWGVYPFLPSGNIIASDRESGLLVLKMEETTGVTDVEDSVSFSVFPNPVNDLLKIEFEYQKEALQISLSDVNGKMIYEDNLNKNEQDFYSIEMKDMTKGIYFLNVNGAIQKIIKN